MSDLSVIVETLWLVAGAIVLTVVFVWLDWLIESGRLDYDWHVWPVVPRPRIAAPHAPTVRQRGL